MYKKKTSVVLELPELHGFWIWNIWRYICYQSNWSFSLRQQRHKWTNNNKMFPVHAYAAWKSYNL